MTAQYIHNGPTNHLWGLGYGDGHCALLAPSTALSTVRVLLSVTLFIEIQQDPRPSGDGSVPVPRCTSDPRARPKAGHTAGIEAKP